MSELPLKNAEKARSLWRAAALVLAVVFAPVLLAGLVNLLRR
jgi:hypothetical protein